MRNEFGSDFHAIKDYHTENSLILEYFPIHKLYASGRQSIVDVFIECNYRRLWMPQYFCYEVIRYLEKSGIEICFYENYPGFDDTQSINSINFQKGDVLLRVNYFDLSDWKDSSCFDVDIIEDHTHNMISDWALNSNAKWCIASWRKTFPTAGGGIAWSPSGIQLSQKFRCSSNYNILFAIRWQAMQMKANYLLGGKIDKSDFLLMFAESEELLDSLTISPICRQDKAIIETLDYKKWFKRKMLNWKILCESSLSNVKVVFPKSNKCLPFSLLLIFNNKIERDDFRKKLIENAIYPAVLWNIPEDRIVTEKVRNFSEKVLSVHCDGRYSESDIILLKNKLEQILWR